MRKLLLLAVSTFVFSAFAQEGAGTTPPPAAPEHKEMPAKKDMKAAKKHGKHKKGEEAK
jgi:hypothetical protein